MKTAVLGWVLAALMAAQSASAQEDGRRIFVSGTGVVSVAPDVAVLTVGVSREEETAKAAMDGVATAMTEVFGALDGFEVADEDRQTSNLTLRPVYPDERNGNGNRSSSSGFQARNMLTVT